VNKYLKMNLDTSLNSWISSYLLARPSILFGVWDVCRFM